MKSEVRILEQAQADLLEIRRFIAQDAPFPSEQAASAMLDRLLDRIESLSELPLRGSRPRDERLRRKGYRFLVERPYLVFYKVHGSKVWVHRVIHGKRAYERIL